MFKIYKNKPNVLVHSMLLVACIAISSAPQNLCAWSWSESKLNPWRKKTPLNKETVLQQGRLMRARLTDFINATQQMLEDDGHAMSGKEIRKTSASLDKERGKLSSAIIRADSSEPKQNTLKALQKSTKNARSELQKVSRKIPRWEALVNENNRSALTKNELDRLGVIEEDLFSAESSEEKRTREAEQEAEKARKAEEDAGKWFWQR